MKRALCVLINLLPLLAQHTVAPTSEPVGPARGEDYQNYNFVQSYELGVRLHGVGGNEGKYRSDVNYGNGVRLLASRFSMNSKGGRAKLLDELTIWTQGLGNDPYQSAGLRAQKNGLWRYDLQWRSSTYFNPALAIANGQHGIDTTRQWQDHDLTLLPQSRFKFLLGYSHNAQDGPALSTANLFDIRGDEFPLLAEIHRKQREFRVGNEFRVFGVKVHWVRSWERFEESTPLSILGVQTGNNSADRSTLTNFSRTEPYRGDTPGWRVNLFKDGKSLWGVNGRVTYSSGRRQFAFDESGVGTDRLGSALNRQILVDGDAERHVTTGQLTLSLFPTDKLTLTNHSSLYSTRMEGNSSYVELSSALRLLERVDFQFLGVRNFSNSTDASYQLAKRVQVHGGYQYAQRLFRSVELQNFGDFTDRLEASQKNHAHAGLFGIRLQPVTGLTVALGGELGRQDKPFYPIADKDYHALSARTLYRKKSLTLSATARSSYNFNASGLASYSARARTYSLDSSWQPKAWLSVEAGYTKLHSDTASWLAYFASGSPVTGGRSLWVSNIHAGHLMANLSFGPRVSASLGYSRTQDTGGRLPGVTPSTTAFLAAQQFPMQFESPLGSVSVRLNEKMRWNAGYQYYRYLEDPLPSQNYRAHTGFTSLLWTF